MEDRNIEDRVEKKKRQKAGGRKKGTPNKSTAVTRDIINQLASGMIEKVEEDLMKLSPRDRVTAFLKLIEFNIPKPQTIAIDMAVEKKHTIEDKLLELSGD